MVGKKTRRHASIMIALLALGVAGLPASQAETTLLGGEVPLPSLPVIIPLELHQELSDAEDDGSTYCLETVSCHDLFTNKKGAGTDWWYTPGAADAERAARYRMQTFSEDDGWEFVYGWFCNPLPNCDYQEGTHWYYYATWTHDAWFIDGEESDYYERVGYTAHWTDLE